MRFTIRHPSSTTSFQYDNAGELTNTIYPDGYTVARSYDLAGDPINVTDSSGKSTDKFYDGFLRLMAISNDVPYGAQVISAAYGRDLYDSVTDQMTPTG